MKQGRFAKLHPAIRQLGQGMTEFILIAAAVGIGGIFVYTQFGDVLRHQTAASAKALAGLDGKGLPDAAREIAVTASAGASRGLGNFANPGSYDGGGLSEGEAGDGGDDGGSVGGAPGSDGGMPGGNGGTPGGEDNPTLYEPPSPEAGMGKNQLEKENMAVNKVRSDPLTYPKVQALINLSPTLKADIAKLDAAGWKFRFVEDYSRIDRNDREGKRDILIKNDADERGTVQKLSHEVGHALRTVIFNPMSKEAFVQTRLEDEGAAVIKNIQVQREILKNGGEDIGVNCSTPPCDKRYEKIYDQYLADGNIDAARKAIAQKRADEWAGDGKKTYKEYYGDGWEDMVKNDPQHLQDWQQFYQKYILPKKIGTP